MQHSDEILALLTLTPVDDDAFTARNPDTLLQRTYGGQVMAQALSAVYQTVDADRLAHSLKGYFLRPGAPETPITYRVTRTRDGGTFSMRRVQAYQGDREIFLMTVSLKEPEDGLEHAQEPNRAAPPPEDCMPLSGFLGQASRSAAALWEQEFAAIDARFVGMGDYRGGSQMQVWLRTSGALPDDPRVHQMMLAYASDLTLLGVTTLPHPGVFGSRALLMATVDHSLWFHRPIRADEWVLYDQGSPNASNALGLAYGRLYDRHGSLGATSTQEGLIRMTEEA